jgi:hypothetical protein
MCFSDLEFVNVTNVSRHSLPKVLKQVPTLIINDQMYEGIEVFKWINQILSNYEQQQKQPGPSPSQPQQQPSSSETTLFLPHVDDTNIFNQFSYFNNSTDTINPLNVRQPVPLESKITTMTPEMLMQKRNEEISGIIQPIIRI